MDVLIINAVLTSWLMVMSVKVPTPRTCKCQLLDSTLTSKIFFKNGPIYGLFLFKDLKDVYLLNMYMCNIWPDWRKKQRPLSMTW